MYRLSRWSKVLWWNDSHHESNPGKGFFFLLASNKMFLTGKKLLGGIWTLLASCTFWVFIALSFAKTAQQSRPLHCFITSSTWRVCGETNLSMTVECWKCSCMVQALIVVLVVAHRITASRCSEAHALAHTSKMPTSIQLVQNCKPLNNSCFHHQTVTYS